MAKYPLNVQFPLDVVNFDEIPCIFATNCPCLGLGSLFRSAVEAEVDTRF